MIQEDKELLLVDLCARLPYGVVVELDEKFGFNKGTRVLVKELLDLYCVEGMKPYLRPMSSMTEEKNGHVNDIIDEFADRWLDSDVAKDKWDATFWQCSEIVNYLNSIHIDYRGLIEKGLAIEVTEENNPYKTEEQ